MKTVCLIMDMVLGCLACWYGWNGEYAHGAYLFGLIAASNSIAMRYE